MRGKKGKMVLNYVGKLILTGAGLLLFLIISAIIFQDKLLPIADYIAQKLSFKI